MEVSSHDIPSYQKPRYTESCGRVSSVQECPFHFRLYCQTHLFQKCCFTFFFRVFKENACWLSILIDDSTIGICHFRVHSVSFQIGLMRWVSFCFNLMIIKCTSYIIKKRIYKYILKMTIYRFIDSNWNQFNWLAVPALFCWIQMDANLLNVE